MYEYPSNIEQKIGFTEIQNIISLFWFCSMGKDTINTLHCLNDETEILKLVNQVMEMCDILQDDTFPMPSFSHNIDSIQSIYADGTYLQPDEMHNLRHSLREIQDVIHFFDEHQEKYTELNHLVEQITIAKEICIAIDRILDANGNLKDNASTKLIEIRQEMSQKRRIITKIMSQKLAIARQEGWLEQDSELSVRDGRLVIPIQSTFKRKIQGIVHDESATGKTSFVEPIEAFETNNALTNLEFEERKEIINILKTTTAEIRPFLVDIRDAYLFLGELDAIQAKAKFTIEIDGSKPNISQQKELSLKRARHPLLYINSKKNHKEVIPLNIILNPEQRIMVISGPNAGGKSVCMKTVLLLQYMFQSGLPISADESSTLFIFNNILVDIGDEQSLENDLSTYSSHLQTMKIFLEHATPRTLFAIDEFGTGTEPMLGGAIAESVLETLNAKGAYGIITTHYSNLKHCATGVKGLINGAMLFDMENIKPLYKLRIGSAGNSFAFEIAQSIGLPQYILDKAKTKTKQEHIDYDENLKQLEIEKQYVYKKKEELRKQEQQLHTLQEEYAQKLKKINEKKQEIFTKTEQEIQDVLDSVNKKIEQTICAIKESHADKEITKQVRQDMQQFTTKTQEHIHKMSNAIKMQKHTNQQDKKKIEIGDFVSIEGQNAVGEVLEVQDKTAVVAFGVYKMSIKTAKLRHANKPQTTTKPIIVATSLQNIAEKRKTFFPHLDLRGKRGDEALYEVKDFVETANMLQIKSLEILHGKGYGILRKLIRDYLATVDFIESCQDAPIEMGGDGITIVRLY